MARKKEITTACTFGKASKAEIFEELIYKVLGAKVKLAPAPAEKAGEKQEVLSCQT